MNHTSPSSDYEKTIQDQQKQIEALQNEVRNYQEQLKAQESTFTQIFDLYNQLEQQKKTIEIQKDELGSLYNEIVQRNEEINQQSEEIRAQRDTLMETTTELERKNLHISDSINYAKRIQHALLPNIQRIHAYFEDVFILFRPRNVVSGDFYWVARKGSRMATAVVDCTGHGVPGAFMSIIGIVAMNQIFIEQGIFEPDKMLTRLHQYINLLLKQKRNDSRDGMDLALCVYDSDSKELMYSGAMNPLYYVQNNEFKEIKATKKPIGGIHHDHLSFEKYSIFIDTPTTFYLSSDGFQDQFGGKDKRKFMVKHFRTLLNSIQNLPFEEQKTQLEQTLDKWIIDGKEDQTDDILVIGFKLQ